MPRESIGYFVFNVFLACLWVFLTAAGFAAISHQAENLLSLYVVAAATAMTLFIRWIWRRRSG
jgi:hypothetical protein